MNNIVYVDVTEDKSNIVILKLTVDEEKNKFTIPKSTITNKGIMDSTNINGLEKRFLVNMEYVSRSMTKDKLVELLNRVDEDSDTSYAVSITAKEIVFKLAGDNLITLDNFIPYTGVGTLFITDLLKELHIVKTDDFTVFNFTDYLKSKTTVSDLITSKNLFFYKDMIPGVYFSYANKETIKKTKDHIDIVKTRIVLGKRATTNLYTVYDMKPQEEIDKLYTEFRNKNNIDYYTIMLLDNVKNSKGIFYRDKLEYKEAPRRFQSPTENVLISEVFPAGVSYYAFEIFTGMKKLLDNFKSDKNDSNVTIHDITSEIYDDKYEIKHLKDFTIDYEYILNDIVYKIPVISGVDLYTRNQLKKISKLTPTVNLVVKNINNTHLEYYIITKMKDEYMITANIPANLVILKRN